MAGKRNGASFIAVALLVLSLGCSSSDGENGSENGPDVTGPATGTYAGTWSGNVCGRGLTMNIVQNGLALSGDYALTDPDFGEGMSGTVSSEVPPASAVLNAGGDRRFEIDFESYQSLSGGFYKGTDRVCEVRATR